MSDPFVHFKVMVKEKSSDLILREGERPAIRVEGKIRFLSDERFTPEDAEQLLSAILSAEEIATFRVTMEKDVAFVVPGVGRFRANLFRDRKGIGAVFRQIPTEILSAEKLNLPKAVMDLCHLSKGLVVVIWSYPRGAGLSKQGETAIDVVAYAAQIACQLGAHIVKVKPPTEHLEQDEAKKVFTEQKIPIGTLADRVRHVVQASFGGRRIVIFSGGEAKDKAGVIEEIKGIAEGGGFGSIIGRNSFQRPKGEAIELLHEVMDIYANA